MFCMFLIAGTGKFEPIEKVTEANFDSQVNAKVKGNFFKLQKSLPHLALK